MRQPNAPTMAYGQQRSHSQQWQRAFIKEWCRLAEGRADLEQTADAALELYTVHGARNPEAVAREEWGTPT
jgi:hypothetical protein